MQSTVRSSVKPLAQKECSAVVQESAESTAEASKQHVTLFVNNPFLQTTLQLVFMRQSKRESSTSRAADFVVTSTILPT